MPILIDGHNLIGRLLGLSLQDPDDEEQLVRLLVAYRARARKTITVVFDPGGAFALPGVRRYGGIEVVFAPHGSSADSVIIRRVQRSPDPRGWLVVTSDHKLAETVTRLGARARSADSFAAELVSRPDAAPDWRETPLSPEEVESWLDLFENQS